MNVHVANLLLKINRSSYVDVKLSRFYYAQLKTEPYPRGRQEYRHGIHGKSGKSPEGDRILLAFPRNCAENQRTNRNYINQP